MKKVIFVLCLFNFFLCDYTYSQVDAARADCSKVWLLYALPRIDPFIVPLDPPFQQTPCNILVNNYFQGLLRTYLEKKDNSGNFVIVAGPQVDVTDYTNLAQGTYRVRMELITNDYTNYSSCARAFKNGVNLGQLGKFGTPFYTNEVVVGVPAQSDNSVTFLNGNGVYLDNNSSYDRYFDPNEPIRIDASSCRNFNEYQVTILEYWSGNPSWPGRWRGLGNDGYGGFFNTANRTLGVEDLRALWNRDGADNWTFIPGNSYRLQVTIRNSNCNSWVDNLTWFYICDNPNWACRGGIDQAATEPFISPNPVSRVFRIEGFTFNPIKSVVDDLVISDLTGRVVKNFSNVTGNEFDVGDLTSGAYFVSVLRDKHKMFTKKLIVTR